MRRIWRSLKLGLKSLLLHKLRSGLTILGDCFRRRGGHRHDGRQRGEKSRCAGTHRKAGRDQHHLPIRQTERRSSGVIHARHSRVELRPEVQGLRPYPRHRPQHREDSPLTRDSQGDSPPRPLHGWTRRGYHGRLRRIQPPGSRTWPIPHRLRRRRQPEFRRARRRNV